MVLLVHIGFAEADARLADRLVRTAAILAEDFGASPAVRQLGPFVHGRDPAQRLTVAEIAIDAPRALTCEDAEKLEHALRGAAKGTESSVKVKVLVEAAA